MTCHHPKNWDGLCSFDDCRACHPVGQIYKIDDETRYYLSKHVEDPEVDIDRILDEHERMRQALAEIADSSADNSQARHARDVLEGR